jgi:hypothetical protein
MRATTLILLELLVYIGKYISYHALGRIQEMNLKDIIYYNYKSSNSHNLKINCFIIFLQVCENVHLQCLRVVEICL